MGAKIPKCLDDYTRWSLDVGVECKRCGRVAVFCAQTVVEWERHLKRRGGARILPQFRCRCGSTSVRLLGLDRSARPRDTDLAPPPLRPIYILREARIERSLRSI